MDADTILTDLATYGHFLRLSLTRVLSSSSSPSSCIYIYIFHGLFHKLGAFRRSDADDHTHRDLCAWSMHGGRCTNRSLSFHLIWFPNAHMQILFRFIHHLVVVVVAVILSSPARAPAPAPALETRIRRSRQFSGPRSSVHLWSTQSSTYCLPQGLRR